MRSLPDACERLVRWGLVALIAFTPLAFGTVEPWSIALMEWGIVTLVLIFGLGRLWPGDLPPAGPRLALTGLEIPLALFLLFCVLQTVPVPMECLQKVSPGSAHAYTSSLAAAGDRGTARGEVDPALLASQTARTPRPVSLRPGETWSRIRLLACFGLAFLLASWWSDRDRIVFLIGTITFVGFLVALFGLVQYLTWNGKIYWIRRVPPVSSFGPFVNRNHFAGYVEMIIPAAIGLAFYLMELRRRPRAGAHVASSGSHGAWGRPVEVWDRRGKGILAFFAAVLLLVSLFFSQSRGGILSATISGCLLFLVVWDRIASRRLAWSLALALPALAIGFIGWIGPEAVGRQLVTYSTIEGEASFQSRIRTWENMIHEMPQFLWVGSGLGAFEDSFAPFVPPGSAKRWDKAHNDYLQLLWETGLIGAALFLAAAIVFARRYWWPALRGRVHPLDVLRIGTAVSILSMALHSIVDFNLQIGANGFLFALLSGLLVALDKAVGQETLHSHP